jgi:predicted porin
MKKLLIATAALAMVAGTAQAQSSVTVYGVLDINYGSVNTDSAGANTAMGQNAWATSRLGFRGTEDLGGGLKAEFQLESQLTPTEGRMGAATAVTNQIFDREAWVGLSSTKFGSIRFGQSDVTGAQAVDSTVGQMGDLTNSSGSLGADKSKVARYTTPNFSGFSAQLGYAQPAASSTTTETTAASIKSALVQYEAGKLGLYAGQTTSKVSASYDQKDTVFALKYDFGVVAVGAYHSIITAATDTNNDRKQTILSASAPLAFLGAGVKGHISYGTDESDTAAVTDLDTTKVALSKAFSKRTSGYVAYATSDSNSATAKTKEAIGYYIGVLHTF